MTNAFLSRFSCQLSIRPKQHEISMATNGGLSVYIVSLETHSFILHYCTKLNIFCPQVYKCQCFQFQPYLANLSCGYGMMGHTRKQNHVEVTKIDNKCRATIFYKSIEPLAHIHNQEDQHSRVAAKCPFNRPRKTWEPNITKSGSTKAYEITNREHLWSNHFFRVRRRA